MVFYLVEQVITIYLLRVLHSRTYGSAPPYDPNLPGSSDRAPITRYGVVGANPTDPLQEVRNLGSA